MADDDVLDDSVGPCELCRTQRKGPAYCRKQKGHTVAEYPPAVRSRRQHRLTIYPEIQECSKGDDCSDIESCENNHACRAGANCLDRKCIYDHPLQPERKHGKFFYSRDAWASEKPEVSLQVWLACPTREHLAEERARKTFKSASDVCTAQADVKSSKRKRSDAAGLSKLSRQQAVSEILGWGASEAYSVAMDILKELAPEKRSKPSKTNEAKLKEALKAVGISL